MNTTCTPVENAIRAAGGRKADLARAVGLSHEAIRRWVATKQIPVKRLLAVEAATGISRHELRPDIYPEPERPSV